jgi:hypothetical protein
MPAIWFGLWYGVAEGTIVPPVVPNSASVYGLPLLFCSSVGDAAITTLTLEESLRSALCASVALSTLVGGRVLPDMPVQKNCPLPWVIYDVATESVSYHFTGKGRTRQASVTLDILATSASQRRAVFDLVVGLLDDFRGILGGAGGVYVAETVKEGTNFDVVRLADGSDRLARLATLSLTMWYTPPA